MVEGLHRNLEIVSTFDADSNYNSESNKQDVTCSHNGLSYRNPVTINDNENNMMIQNIDTFSRGRLSKQIDQLKSSKRSRDSKFPVLRTKLNDSLKQFFLQDDADGDDSGSKYRTNL